MEQHTKVYISDSLSDDEWEIMNAFCKKVKRLRQTQFISRQGCGIKASMNYEMDKGLKYECTLPTEEIISEFLMAFRFFYLQKEKTNFLKLLKLLSKHTENENARNTLNEYKKQWRDCLFSHQIEVEYNGEKVTSSMLLDLWFNAHYFHSDERKEKMLDKHKKIFTEDFSKYMMLEGALESSRFILETYKGIIDIVEERFNTKRLYSR